MTEKELWEKSQVWESSDDGRGKLKILESVEKFAQLVRADEREACAKIAEEWAVAYPHPSRTIAVTIRMQGDKHDS